MSDTLKQVLLDLKARQLAGEHMPCPRCGLNTMKPKIHENATSRQADLYVCDDCGTSEALLDMMRRPLPLTHWSCFKAEQPRADFKALPGEAAWQHLQKTQVPYLSRLFEQWQTEKANEEFDLYRLAAYRDCEGLTALWSQPFQAAYQVADGQLLVRFRAGVNGTEVAYDLIPEPRR
ncbi:MAG: hypothetical protein VB099_02800 [Candidatus Limiplasma sp.]|nr:hypothetical protein [Candidatus Limiplasma sp.]